MRMKKLKIVVASVIVAVVVLAVLLAGLRISGKSSDSGHEKTERSSSELQTG